MLSIILDVLLAAISIATIIIILKDWRGEK